MTISVILPKAVKSVRNRCIPSMHGSRGCTHRSGFSLLLLALLFAEAVDASIGDDCRPLLAVNIEASAVLDPHQAQVLADPYIGACINPQLIQNLLAAFSTHFIDQGYVTTRPYLLEQDISDGEIDLELLVGTIEAIIDSETGSSNLRIASAFAFKGQILNLRDLEAALEVLERPRSVQASFEIRPGSRQGSSIIAIKTVESTRFTIELGANARTDVDPQLSFAATLDNPLSLNDILEFRYNSGDVFQAYQSDRSREWSYSVPLGNYLLSLVHSDITYRQRLQGFNGSFVAEGETVSDRLQVDRILSRSQAYRLSLGAGLELDDSTNLFEGEVIDVSSYRTSKAELELRHDWYAAWGQLLSRYAYQQGLDSFGARDDGFLAGQGALDSEARLQFKKHVLEGRLYYYLPNPDWQANLNLYWQHSDDILYQADKLSLGSENTVRGYTSAISGSNGWYGRSELVRRLQTVRDPGAGRPLVKTISLSLGFDYGEIRCEVDNPDVCGTIYGMGAGVTIADDNFSALLSWGHPLKELDDDIGSEDLFLLDLRWRL